MGNDRHGKFWRVEWMAGLERLIKGENCTSGQAIGSFVVMIAISLKGHDK